jgi:glycosyltransferase involved in cell wall biosynthesis
MPAMITCNTRVLAAPVTGIPRYVRELLGRMAGSVVPVAPSRLLSGPAGHLWEQVRLPRLVGDSLLWSPAMTGPLAVRRQVVTVHDLVTIDHPEWMGRAFGGWYGFLLPQLLPRVAHILAVSTFTRDRLVERLGIAPEGITVVANGVDRRFAPQSPQRVADTVRALGLPSPHFVLSVCSLEPRKNMRGLLAAWERLGRELPDDVWLVLSGGQGPARIFGRRPGERLPARVHLTGHVGDAHLPALMAGALAFVYPSFYEGFGLPPLEAMACGTPCLASDRTAIPEVVGDAGLLVPPDDIDAIADGIGRLVQDGALRQTLAARGLARARRFGWDDTAGRTLAVLRAVQDDTARSRSGGMRLWRNT